MLFRHPLGNGRENDPEDVLNAKRAFTRLDLYRPPRYGLTGIIHRPLDGAIKRFQEDNDLKVDGWLSPSGPTRRRLEERLGARWRTVADRGSERPRFRIDLPGWTPTLTNPRTGKDLLAPDGKPFTLSPSRTRELIDRAESLGRQNLREMSESELEELRRWREGLSTLWGSGLPQIQRDEPPQALARLRTTPLPRLKPQEQEEQFESRGLLRDLFERLDRSMEDPSNAPTELPPIDPPSPPPPPFLPRHRPPSPLRPRFRSFR